MKIGFFCIKGLEAFIAPISARIATLPRYEVSENWISDFAGVQEQIAESDIVWLEWANEMSVSLTQQLANSLQNKIVIIRLHSYEALAQMHRSINWNVVSAVVFVADHIKKYCTLEHPNQIVIPNGIQLENFKFSQRTHGNDIAFIGGLSHKKGIMLLAHAFASLPINFKLHMAGEWQDDRERIYFAHIINELGISERVIYYGQMPHDQISDWLSDKNYILCTSPWESHNLSICEAMASGLKPLIHNFWGVTGIYPKEYVWSSFKDLSRMISADSPFDSFAYRKFIKKRYDFDDKIKRILDLIAYLQTFVPQSVKRAS